MRDLHLIPTYVAKAFTDYPILKWGGVALAVASEYLFGTEVVRNMAIAAFSLMFLDTITGFVAAFCTGLPITSAKLSRILVKIVAYGSSILVAAIVTRHLPGLVSAHATVVTAVIAIVIATEALSIIENIGKMGFKRLAWLSKILEGKLKQLETDPLKPRPEEVEGYRPLG